MPKFYIIKIQPGHGPRLEECPKYLTDEYLQAAVDGRLIWHTLPHRSLIAKHLFIEMLGDIEGERRGKAENVYASQLHCISSPPIFGDVVMLKNEQGDFLPFTELEATALRDDIEQLYNLEFEEAE